MDGEEVLASETYEFGAAVTPIEDPVKEGYAFMGWEPEVPATMPDSDVTVYAGGRDRAEHILCRI